MTFRSGRMDRLPVVVLIGGALAILPAPALSQDAPFGSPDDVSYAKALWQFMADVKLVGEDSIKVRPFEGNEPHGSIQEVLATVATIEGHDGELLVKRNHGGPEGLTIQDVYDNPDEHLAAVTIMFKREDGYDPENQNWFWAKYLPDGELDVNPSGVPLAGRVAKGAEQGCIACHSAAGGDDLEVLTAD